MNLPAVLGLLAIMFLKAEKITKNVIEQQSLNIDAISGATGSGKAILKAIESVLQ